MKKYLLLSIQLLCVVVLINTATANNIYAQTKGEQQVAAAVQQLRTAMIDGKREALENITSPNLSYGHSSGKMEDRAAFVEALASGKSDFITMELTDQTIKVVDNTALVRHTLTGETKDNGVAGTVKLGVLLVWHKEKGKWKLLARQAFKL